MIRRHLTLVTVFFWAIFLVSACSPQNEKNKSAEYLSSGQSYFENKSYDNAKIQLMNAVNADPDSIKAHKLLAETYLMTDNAQGAFTEYLRLEQLEPGNVETLTRLAAFFLAGKKIPEAKRRIEEILKVDPNSIDGLYLDAGVHTLENASVEILMEKYQSILDLDPNQTRALISLSRLYMANNEYAKAEETIKNAIVIAPEDNQMHMALYFFYLSQTRLDAAEKALKDFVDIKPDDPEPQMVLASFYADQRSVEKAEEHYLKALEIDPDSVKTRMLLARLYNATQKPELAEVQIKKSLAIDPEDMAVKNAYAEFYLLQGNNQQAETLVDEILTTRPKFSPARQLKGKLLIMNEDYERGISIFRDLVQEEPDSPMYNFLLGSALAEQGKVDQALNFISDALEKNSNFHQARYLYAQLYLQKGDLTSAEKEISKILNQVPLHYNSNMMMANIYMARGELDSSYAIFKKMEELLPENPQALVGLGRIASLKKDNDLALVYLEKALEINPDQMGIFSNVITILASQKKLDQAHKRCDTRLADKEIEPSTRAFISNLKANLHLTAKEYPQAEVLLNQAIKDNPEFIQPYLTLAQLFKSQSRTDEAIARYKTLIEQRPGFAAPENLLATLFDEQGEFDKAEVHYKRALEIDKEFLPALNNLAYLYAEQEKELNKALDLAQRAKQKNTNSPAITDTLGWVYFKKELYDMAIAEFKTTIEKEPENPIFHFHLGLSYSKKWDYENAKTALERALEIDKDFKGNEQAMQILSELRTAD